MGDNQKNDRAKKKKKFNENQKYHFGIRGVPVPCHAKVRPCPFGGFETHYSSFQSAMMDADIINQKLAQLDKTNTIGIAQGEKNCRISKEFDKALRILHNADYFKKKYQEILNETKAEITKAMEDGEVPRIRMDDGTLISLREASEKNIVDVDKLKDDNLYDDYTKEVKRGKFLQFDDTHSDSINGYSDFVKETSYTRQNLHLTMTGDKEGKVTVDKHTYEMLSRYVEAQDKLKKLDEEMKRVKGRMIEEMEQAGTDNIRSGGTILKYNPETTVLQVDTSLLKKDKIYDSYTVKSYSPSTIMVRKSKKKPDGEKAS